LRYRGKSLPAPSPQTWDVPLVDAFVPRVLSPDTALTALPDANVDQ